MASLPATVFANSDVRLRVWFNDGIHGSQLLTPDQRIGSAAFAMTAATVPDGSITAAKIAVGAVGGTELAPEAVGTAQLAVGAVQAPHLAPGVVAADLNAAGQSGVSSGGVVLSATENAALAEAGYVRIGATITTDTWQKRVTGTPPTARVGHTAVWTGSEMIVWGGGGRVGLVNDGARFNPAANNWSAVS
jgi:hypothetical protein